MAAMFTPFHYAFVQQGVWEVLLLSVAAGLIGTWIVLRGLAFYGHAIGTAAFPGLVLADGLSFSPLLGAFGAAGIFALAVAGLGRRRRDEYGSFTALVLVGALALGVILASDVFHSGSSVETLLFGSLLLIGDRELVVAAAASLGAVAATVLLGRRWVAVGFDPSVARSLGVRSSLPDALLLALVAVTVVASLSALGALLVSALLVVPAATTRLWTRTLLSWQLARSRSQPWKASPGCGSRSRRTCHPVRRSRSLQAASSRSRRCPGGAARRRRCAPARRVRLDRGGNAGVVATTTQIADWARIVGGDAVSVHQILRPNTDPHEYEPRPSDVQARAARRWCSRAATASTAGWARSCPLREGARRWSTSARRFP